jgi:hypothetical protein
MAAPRTDLPVNGSLPEAKNAYTAAQIEAQEQGNSLPPFKEWIEQERAKQRAMANMQARM